MFIALEGLDGSGKGTLSRHLSQRFSLPVVAFPSPNTPQLQAFLRGERSIRPKALFCLFLHDILQHVPEKGLVDRYVFSTIAYERDGLGYERAKAIVEALDVPKPKAVLYLKVSVETALRRSRGEHIYDKDRALQEEVFRRYERMREEQFLAPWFVIDAEQPIEGMLKEGEALLRRLLA